MSTAKGYALGVTTLLIVLVSALPLGSNRPLFWLLLAIVVGGVFAVQMAFDLRLGVDQASRRAVLPILLYTGVLLWACIQSSLPVELQWAHPVWSTVSSPTEYRISADPIETQHHLVRLSTYGMVFWVALRASRVGGFADLSLRAIAIFASALSVYGVLSVVFRENLVLGDLASGSVSATFVNRNNFATFAIMGFLANLTVYVHRFSPDSSDRLRGLRNFLETFYSGGWLFALGVLICLAAILFSESRAGFAAALIGVAVFSSTGRRQNTGSTYAITFVVFVLALSLLAFSSGTIARVFAAGGEDARFLIYPLILEGIADRPFLGHGLGAFHDGFRLYVTPELSVREIDLAHSSYLENVFELGAPAALMFYLALGAVALVIFKGTRRRRRYQRITRFAFAVTAAAAFHALFDFSLQIPAIAALFAFILGLGWGQSFPEEVTLRRPGSGKE